MTNSNLSRLLPRTWYFIAFAGVIGYFVGYLLQQVYAVSLDGFELVIALYSVGLVWAGLVVGFQTKTSKK